MRQGTLTSKACKVKGHMDFNRELTLSVSHAFQSGAGKRTVSHYFISPASRLPAADTHLGLDSKIPTEMIFNLNTSYTSLSQSQSPQPQHGP
jgi:hypothetical protein